MFLLSKTCYSLLAFARFEWLLSVLFCFRWNYSVSHFYDVSKKPSLLRFSVFSLLDFFVYRSHIFYTLPLSSSSALNLLENAYKIVLLHTCNNLSDGLYHQNCITSFTFGSSPRLISTRSLHTLLHFHFEPIYHVVFMESYFSRMGNLILRLASCLDAFSTYPSHT